MLNINPCLLVLSTNITSDMSTLLLSFMLHKTQGPTMHVSSQVSPVHSAKHQLRLQAFLAACSGTFFCSPRIKRGPYFRPLLIIAPKLASLWNNPLESRHITMLAVSWSLVHRTSWVFGLIDIVVSVFCRSSSCHAVLLKISPQTCAISDLLRLDLISAAPP